MDIAICFPSKKEYFKYFTIDDLKKHFRIERRDVSNDKTVKVTLEIPIKEQNGQVNYVTYERFYYETNSEFRMKRTDG